MSSPHPVTLLVLLLPPAIFLILTIYSFLPLLFQRTYEGNMDFNSMSSSLPMNFFQSRTVNCFYSFVAQYWINYCFSFSSLALISIELVVRFRTTFAEFFSYSNNYHRFYPWALLPSSSAGTNQFFFFLLGFFLNAYKFIIRVSIDIMTYHNNASLAWHLIHYHHITWNIINIKRPHNFTNKIKLLSFNINNFTFHTQSFLQFSFQQYLQQIQHKIMAGKKWCEYCRINLPFDKKAIQQHEATRMHIQNKQKHIKFERIKLQRQEKAKRQISKANNFISTANIPKAKKGSELQKQVEEYRNDIYMSGKMAIHQLIAQKTKGLYGAPIEYPEKQDLVLAQNYQDKDENSNQQNEDQKFQMWKIDICQQTGKPCFINRISQAKSYEPPKGYILSEQQKQEWQETKKICEEIPDENLQEVGEVGQWQQAQQQDYFEQNRAPSQNYNDQDLNEQKQIIKKERQQELVKEQQNVAKNRPQVVIPSWIDNLQQRIRKNEVTQQQVISTMLTNTLQQCRTVKQKNEALKKLIRSDFEIKATLDKNDEELIKMEQEEPKKSIGFKPRKKVKTFQIVEQKDIV